MAGFAGCDVGGGILSQIHAFITITLQADQVVSGLVPHISWVLESALVFGESLSKAGAISLLPRSHPIFRKSRSSVRSSSPIKMFWFILGICSFPLLVLHQPHTPGMHLRAVGEYPAAADSLGINVYRLRYIYVFVCGLFAGLAGATISLAISPGWFSELTTAGQGWIAVGLVIFAQWDPFGQRLDPILLVPCGG